MSNTTGDNVNSDITPHAKIHQVIHSARVHIHQELEKVAVSMVDQNTLMIGLKEDLQKANERIAMMENQRKFDNDMLKGKDERIAELQTRVKCAERLIDFELMAQYESDCADAINKPESGV